MYPNDHDLERAKDELLRFIEPFAVNAVLRPNTAEREHIVRLLDKLSQCQPDAPSGPSRSLLSGMWQCRYTNSEHVLGLNRFPALQLSSVYQKMQYDPLTGAGYYINVGELSAGGRVRLACGEYARICMVDSDKTRIEVSYEHFYFAPRLLRGYEGHDGLVAALETNRTQQVFRYPFRKAGWQTLIYLDATLRIVRGNNGGLFILTR